MLRHEASEADETDDSYLSITEVEKDKSVKAGLPYPKRWGIALQKT